MRIKQLFLTITASVIVIGSASATDKQYNAVDGSLYTKICMTAANGNKLQLIKVIEDSGFSHHYVANQVTCNGMNIGQFAAQAGNQAAHNYLNKFLKKSSEEARIAKQ
ncbi:DUF3718 domain-containing protein [Aliikangiella sp. IMCC44359]|uniref:DUF3718 domain-containing protein n=1 Tax=Aliikangiella sp. IMCC44359 TaxID=3459125 RepID=UPI00403AF3DA